MTQNGNRKMVATGGGVLHEIVERFAGNVVIRRGMNVYQVGVDYGADGFAVVSTRGNLDEARVRARELAERGA